MRFLLLPISWIYGSVVFLRNRLYDWGIFKTNEFAVPLIVIGNLAVGGTGKTPHTEYLIRLLSDKKRVAVLSRGYGRKTKGFVLATAQSTPREIGDEPYQIYNKFPHILLAVCEDRALGINTLLSSETPPEVILLDDAFQHRKIKAGLNIVLTQYVRPFFKDYMIPTGKLRDNKREIKRAQVLIYTKVPESEKKQLHKFAKLSAQNLVEYYSSFDYQGCIPFFDADKLKTESSKVILVTGIANPDQIAEYVAKNHEIVHHFAYRDHCDFSDEIVNEILKKKRSFANERISVLTTEKDFVKLKFFVCDEDDFYYVPITVKFLEKTEEFDQLITTYINDYSCR